MTGHLTVRVVCGVRVVCESGHERADTTFILASGRHQCDTCGGTVLAERVQRAARELLSASDLAGPIVAVRASARTLLVRPADLDAVRVARLAPARRGPRRVRVETQPVHDRQGGGSRPA